MDNDEDSDLMCSQSPVIFSRLDSLRILRSTFFSGQNPNENSCNFNATGEQDGLVHSMCVFVTQVYD